MSHCLSLDWNVIPVVRGIQERFALKPDCVAKTEHRTPKYSNGCCGLPFFLHGLPTDNLHLGISVQIGRELGPGTQSRTSKLLPLDSLIKLTLYRVRMPWLPPLRQGLSPPNVVLWPEGLIDPPGDMGWLVPSTRKM